MVDNPAEGAGVDNPAVSARPPFPGEGKLGDLDSEMPDPSPRRRDLLWTAKGRRCAAAQRAVQLQCDQPDQRQL